MAALRRAVLTPRASAWTVGLFVLGLAAQADAHGARLPFAQWGGFSVGSVRCQRVIARAAAECAAAAWHARRACRSAELAGRTCDATATEARLVAIRNKALDTVDAYCSERQAIDLQYLGSFDLQADVSRFCRAWPTAAESAVYLPFAGASGRSGAERQCAEAADDAADGVMQSVFRNRRQCMDRVASIAVHAPNRAALLDAAAQRMDSAQTEVVARLTARCGAGAFAALYGRTPDVFASGLAARADCLGGQFYIQDAVLCPAPVCGNGIVERPEDPLLTDEDCDDGNTADGDACPSTCRLQ